jgi:hypothetical protein
LLLILVILAIKTIEGAGVIKNGQIFVAIFRAL